MDTDFYDLLSGTQVAHPLNLEKREDLAIDIRKRGDCWSCKEDEERESRSDSIPSADISSLASYRKLGTEEKSKRN
jgi:hypothetical protein